MLNFHSLTFMRHRFFVIKGLCIWQEQFSYRQDLQQSIEGDFYEPKKENAKVSQAHHLK
jgi:hypothetical protein